MRDLMTVGQYNREMRYQKFKMFFVNELGLDEKKVVIDDAMLIFEDSNYYITFNSERLMGGRGVTLYKCDRYDLSKDSEKLGTFPTYTETTARKIMALMK